MEIPRILIAGVSSGVGKTMITSSIIYGLRKKGFSVQSFKVGPDYIDPSYLETISKNRSHNLDSWLMGSDGVRDTFINNSNSDVSVIEGVMGFYDGFNGKQNLASSHHISSILKCPVILVVDASRIGRSIGSIVLGFLKFHSSSNIVGVILNKIGSKKHATICKDALSKINIQIFGIIPKKPNFGLESRHLGLIPTMENKKIKKSFKDTVSQVSQFINIDQIFELSKNTPKLPVRKKNHIKKTTIKIAIALDKSFNFYYHDNLGALIREGADLKFFSPIKDKKLPPCEGLYIGGGFPEIMGASLSKNYSMKKQIKSIAEQNMPIYAECGGLMYLTKSIRLGKKKYNMVGLFNAETKMTKKMKLNYTKGRMVKRNIISGKNYSFRGHESNSE